MIYTASQRYLFRLSRWRDTGGSKPEECVFEEFTKLAYKAFFEQVCVFERLLEETNNGNSNLSNYIDGIRVRFDSLRSVTSWEAEWAYIDFEYSYVRSSVDRLKARIKRQKSG